MSLHFSFLITSSFIIFLVIAIVLKLALFIRNRTYEDLRSLIYYSQVEQMSNPAKGTVMKVQNFLTSLIVVTCCVFGAVIYLF